jgi:RNA polymerase sigma-70 factor (ECF subfamily)
MNDMKERARSALARIWPRLVSFTRRLSASDGDDLAQEACARALECALEGDTERIRRFVFQIAANAARDAHRRRARESRVLRRIAARAGQDPPAGAPAEVPPDALARAIRALPDPQREVLLMRIRDGVPFREIARRLGIPLNTALGRMHLAVERLRRELQP